jgi:predicted CXXCH cytochrome family protein
VKTVRRDILLSVSLAAVLLAALVSHSTWGDEVKPGWVKGLMCLACHKALNKELVERYKSTKHAKAEPTEKMDPVDIYRRCVGFNPADSTYFEPGVGCQACHGPGAAHLAAKSKEDKLATMPRPDQLKTPHQKLSLCGRCHGQYTVGGQPFVTDFKPGDDLFAMEGFKLADVEKPAPFQQLNDFMHSKHADNDVTCITCHTSHEPFAGEPQLRKAVPDLCLQCHANAHQCKKPQAEWPEKATCVTCHMPDGRHTFAVQK